MLTIKANAYYRTRNGEKAYVATILPKNSFTGKQEKFPICGYTNGFIRSWTKDGRYSDDLVDGNLDLIAEWVDDVTIPVHTRLSLVVGKSYKTRGGWRAKVVADDLGHEDCFAAVHYMPSGARQDRHYSDGRFLKHSTDQMDLIAEYVDPPKTLECWVVCCDNKPIDFGRTQREAEENAFGYQEVNDGTNRYTVKHMREVVGE